MRAVFFRQWEPAKVGTIDSSILWENVGLFLGGDKDILRDDCYGTFVVNEETFNIARRLKDRGYKLGLLSNNIRDWFERNINERNLKDLFDHTLSSHACGFAKPDLRIYNHFLSLINVDPTKCVFIDDKERNLIPVRELGMSTIRFQNSAALESELKALGVL